MFLFVDSSFYPCHFHHLIHQLFKCGRKRDFVKRGKVSVDVCLYGVVGSNIELVYQHIYDNYYGDGRSVYAIAS